ncbi:MAG: TIGR03032 family protein [Wenzhouxiangella sp.]|nr:MAG: TIGR03032 family protein [Wenzhouxiangella sp.]
MSPRQVNLAGPPGELQTESRPASRVRSPWEQESLVHSLIAELGASGSGDNTPLAPLKSALEQFLRQWQGVHARHGDDPAGDPAYRQALEQLLAQARNLAGAWTLPNGIRAAELIDRTLVAGALGGGDDTTEVVALTDNSDQDRVDSISAAASPQSEDAAGTAAEPGPGHDPSALRSVHTRSLPALLKQAASSLLISTYQAGKLVIARESEGRLNTHFRVFNRPMGLAADRARLALGTAITVDTFRNMPDVAAKLEPRGRHDAAFMPRHSHITGNIDIHEMAWAGDELWLVNTRFSCLCTLDEANSFVPRWRPKFISGYAAEDRCHLNGLEVVDGKPRYVTALGTSDQAGGWRENKAGGGVLIDIDSNEFICRGLSMPHSPRWYEGKLWVLESGNGTLATVDVGTGQVETVAALPGFTRGLDFLGPYAFVGLSQVRESAVFSGIALTERVSERNCGVWVVDIRSGQTVAFLRFEDAVQEVFAVSVLQGLRFPDVLSPGDPIVPLSYALPTEALREVIRPQIQAGGHSGKEQPAG